MGDVDTDAMGTGQRKTWSIHDKLASAADIAGILGIIGAIIFSGLRFSASKDALKLTKDALKLTKDALKLTSQQLLEAKYESVYGHQLDLWQLAAGDEKLAPYIVGGKKPPVVAPTDLTAENHVSEAEATRATQDAAIFNALDFYAYVFEQLGPKNSAGDYPGDVLSIKAGEPVPEGYTAYIWYGWPSWASTIKAAFNSAPGMCETLNYHKPGESAYNTAYDPTFVAAVHDAGLCQ